MPRYVLRVNGKEREVDAGPGDNLLAILRDDFGFTGSRYGCGEGQCGACTVLLDGNGARACVTRVATVGSKAITTIEALAQGERLHPVQQAFLDAEAFQCGYCTSGMILIDRRDLPSAGAGEASIICVAPAVGSAVRGLGPVDTALPVRLLSSRDSA